MEKRIYQGKNPGQKEKDQYATEGSQVEGTTTYSSVNPSKESE